MEYTDFIAGKHERHQPTGFSPVVDFPDKLFDWQCSVVEWSLGKGSSAILAECGLGKTACQLSWAENVVEYTGRPVLLLAPIAVGPQTIGEAEKFSISGVRLASSQDDVCEPGVYVTNYHKLDHFDASSFSGVVLDESSILKSATGKTKKMLCDLFRTTPYKLACTATAAPNDYMELGNHSEFIGAMDRDVMLSKYFTHDSGDTSKWRLKKYGERNFWRWVSSWAMCISKPSDVGGDDTGFDLPGLNIHKVIIESDVIPEGHLIKPHRSSVSATDIHKVKRQVLPAKAEKTAEISNGIDDYMTIWVDTDYEADALKKVVDGCVEVRASMPVKKKTDHLTGFSEGRYTKMISKPSIAGFGLNWQHCNKSLYFAGYSFESFYQSIRRHYRYGQNRVVDAYLLASEEEIPVVNSLKRKMDDHDKLKQSMSDAMREGMQEELAGSSIRVHSPNVPVRLPEWLKGE